MNHWDASDCCSPGVLAANSWSLEYWLMRLGSSPLISWASRNSAKWICSGTGRRELSSLWTCRYFWSCEPAGWSFWLRSSGVSMPQCLITGSIRHDPAHFEWKSRDYIFNLKSTSISLYWRRSWWEGCRGRFSGSPFAGCPTCWHKCCRRENWSWAIYIYHLVVFLCFLIRNWIRVYELTSNWTRFYHLEKAQPS